MATAVHPLALAAQRPWLALPLAFGAGAVSATGFAPWSFLPGLFALALLLWLLATAPSLAAAWRRAVAFVFGHAVLSLHWIAIAFTVDAERFGAFAIPAVAILCLIVALIQGSVLALLRLARWHQPVSQWLAFGLLWSAGEALRGILLQFPWNPIGAAAAEWPALAQGAAFGGVAWLGLAMALAASAPALIVLGWEKHRRSSLIATALVLVLVAGIASAGLVRLAEPGRFTDTRLRLVQGAFALDHGFAAARLRTWFMRQLKLTETPHQGPLAAVIWAEGAAPYYLDTDASARQWMAQSLGRLAAEQILITGGDRLLLDRDGDIEAVANGLFVVDENAELQATYEKVHLVPFGEFLPFRYWFRLIGLDKLSAGSIDYGRGPGPVTINLAGLPSFSPLICYEVIFSGQAVGTPRPDFLLNVTNDTWFGDSVGPYQHLAMTQIRAIEEGLPVVRTANSGISANIDALGRVHESLGLGRRGVLDVSLAETGAPTPFVQWRWWPFALSVFAIGLICGIFEAVQRRRERSSCVS